MIFDYEQLVRWNQKMYDMTTKWLEKCPKPPINVLSLLKFRIEEDERRYKWLQQGNFVDDFEKEFGGTVFIFQNDKNKWSDQESPSENSNDL